MDEDPRKITRRSALKTVAAGLGVVTMSGSSVGKKQTKTDSGPIHASGKRKYHFRPDNNSDDFVCREQFISPDLKPRNDNSSKVNFDSVVLPRKAIPKQYREPDRAFTVSYADEGVFGTFEDHMRAERKEKEQLSTDTVSTQRLPDSDEPGTYNGPLYTYKSGSLDEKTAPVNVAWYNSGFTAKNVKQDMNNNGWGSIYWLSTSKYVGYQTSDGKAQKIEDKHAKKEGGLVPGEQWHGRLYNIPDSHHNGYEVVGAFHRDPADHGWIPGDEQWRFADSRQEVVNTWEGMSYVSITRSVGNGGGFPSSNGNLSIIY